MVQSKTSTLQSGIDVPPTIYFFKKCIPGHSYCNPPFINFLAKKTLFQPDPEFSGESNSWSDILPIVCCFERMFA